MPWTRRGSTPAPVARSSARAQRLGRGVGLAQRQPTAAEIVERLGVGPLAGGLDERRQRLLVLLGFDEGHAEQQERGGVARVGGASSRRSSAIPSSRRGPSGSSSASVPR